MRSSPDLHQHFQLHDVCAFLCAMRFLFARLSLGAFSIRVPFFVRSVVYSCDFLCAQLFYLRALLCAPHFFCRVCQMEHMNCSSQHLPAIVHGGER